MKNKSHILSPNLTLFSYIIILIFLVTNASNSLAQKSFGKGFNVGADLGASKLLTEVPYDFSETINEFDNKTGIAYSVEISKYLSQRWEIGFQWNFSNLKGTNTTPEFSAEGFQEGIPDEITEPVEYINHLNGPDIFFRYYFNLLDKDSYFTPFVKLGVGILHYESIFKYIDSDKTIFGKPINGTHLNTPVLRLGTGFKTSVSRQLYLVTSIDFNAVPYDFLDVMHNYDKQGNRNELFGLMAEFKIGIYYSIFSSKPGKGKASGYSTTGYMPFARR